jgi:4-hydroxybenzoate polyprenyltransferase
MLLYGLHLVWQLSQVEGATPPTALKLFRSNWPAGLILFFGIAVDGYVRHGLFG